MLRMRYVLGLFLLALTGLSVGRATPEDDRYLSKEYGGGPGVHELATWLISQLQRHDEAPPGRSFVAPYRLLAAAKRNSELINSILGLKKDVNDNGK